MHSFWYKKKPSSFLKTLHFQNYILHINCSFNFSMLRTCFVPGSDFDPSEATRRYFQSLRYPITVRTFVFFFCLLWTGSELFLTFQYLELAVIDKIIIEYTYLWLLLSTILSHNFFLRSADNEKFYKFNLIKQEQKKIK